MWGFSCVSHGRSRSVSLERINFGRQGRRAEHAWPWSVLVSSLPLMIATFYGWTSSDATKDRLARTSALMGAIAAELVEWPGLPCVVLGDLNATAAKVPLLWSLLSEGAWHEVGLHASAWGAVDSAPTAKAHNSTVPTRLDHMFVNDFALPLIQEFTLGEFGVFDVHRQIAVSLKANTPPPRRAFRVPSPIDLAQVPEAEVLAAIDSCFHAVAPALHCWLCLSQLSQFFALWSWAFEEGLLLAAARHGTPQRRPVRGRGCPKVVKLPPAWAKPTQTHLAEAPEGEAQNQMCLFGRLLILKRKWMLLGSLAKASKCMPGDQWSGDMLACYHAISQLHQELGLRVEQPPALSPGEHDWPRIVVAAKLMAHSVERVAVAEAAAHKSAKRRALRDSLNGADGHATACRLLRDPPPEEAYLPEVC